MANNVPVLIAWIDNKLSTATSAIYRERFGIGITERRVLLQLSLENDISVKRICDVIGTDKGTISRAIRSLERLKLVEAHVNQRDNRVKLNGITRKGRLLIEEVNAFAAKRGQFLVSIFTDDERETLIALLKKLHEHVPAVARYIPE